MHEHRFGEHEAADEDEDDGSANGANAARAGAICRMMASTGPSSAVTASGSASVTQSTTIIARIARQTVRRRR